MELIEYGLEFLKDPLSILEIIISNYGVYIYIFLFFIVFLETGVVIMPFLPGDSLLFAVGMICGGTKEIEITYIIPLLIFAALVGDNLNFFLGKKFGQYIYSKQNFFFLKKEYIEDTEKYFKKNGAKTIVFARFIPVIRTVAPFVAGAGEMKYRIYLFYCIVGAIFWVSSISLLGYFLGDNDWVKLNFTKVILGIMFVSSSLVFFKFLKRRK